MKKQIECPYCGCKLLANIELVGGPRHDIVNCYSDDQNYCEKDFVIKWQTTVEVKTLKIEGA